MKLAKKRGRLLFIERGSSAREGENGSFELRILQRSTGVFHDRM
jgi:hypothetical protein